MSPSPLSGYSLPLTPSGVSSMVTPPPWYFSGEVLMVEYRVDPEDAAVFLPPGVDPGPDPGSAAAVFAEWQWCSTSGAELDDPVRCQFGEFLILLGCAVGGVPMARCPYAWVDRAVPLVRGWIQGMPKQFGSVHMTRAVEVGRAGPRLAAGGRYAASLAAHDRRLVEVTVDASATGAEPPALHTVPLVHTRYFPAWDPRDRPVTELVASEVTDVEFGPVHSGPAKLRLDTGGRPELADLARLRPVEVGAGHRFSYAETLVRGRRLG
jgi:enduracididine biosynthesis enzyme MppR